MNWETTFPPRDVQLEKLRRESQNKSTLRLRSGQAARACSGLTLSGASLPRPQKLGLAPSNGSRMKRPQGMERWAELISSPEKPIILRGEIWVTPEVLALAGFNQGPEGLVELPVTIGADICFFPWLRSFIPSDFKEAVKLSHGAGMGCGVMIDGPFQRLSQGKDLLLILEELGKGPLSLKSTLTEETEKVAQSIRRAEDLRIDLILICDNLAYSSGLYFSPSTFRELLLPFYQILAKQISKTIRVLGWHSDGDVSSILSDMVNCGWRFFALESEYVDLLKFKRTYGNRITLIGGIPTAWLTQEVLDLSKEREYSEEMNLPAASSGVSKTKTGRSIRRKRRGIYPKRKIKTLIREGGFILASSCGLYHPKFLSILKEIYRLVDRIETEIC